MCNTFYDISSTCRQPLAFSDTPSGTTLTGDTEVALHEVVKFTCNVGDPGNPSDVTFEWNDTNTSGNRWNCSPNGAVYTCTSSNDCTTTVSCSAQNTAGLSEWASRDVAVTSGNF